MCIVALTASSHNNIFSAVCLVVAVVPHSRFWRLPFRQRRFHAPPLGAACYAFRRFEELLASTLNPFLSSWQQRRGTVDLGKFNVPSQRPSGPHMIHMAPQVTGLAN